MINIDKTNCCNQRHYNICARQAIPVLQWDHQRSYDNICFLCNRKVTWCIKAY